MHLDLLDRVSAERVRHELELILAEAEPERTLCRLQGLGILRKLHPGLDCDSWSSAKAGELRATLDAVRSPLSAAPPPMSIAEEATPRLYLALLLYSLIAGRGRPGAQQVARAQGLSRSGAGGA